MLRALVRIALYSTVGLVIISLALGFESRWLYESRSSIDALLDDLISGNRAARQTAFANLSKRGSSVISAIRDRLHAFPEHAEPLGSLLGEMIRQGDWQTLLDADDLLRQMADDFDPNVAAAASRVLDEHESFRDQRLLSRLIAAGVDSPQPEQSHTSAGYRNSATTFVVLGEHWQHQPEYRKLLQRLTTVGAIHISSAAPLTRDEFAELRRDCPQLRVITERTPCLGLEIDRRFYGGCRVDRVVAGSPASTVGLRPGDVLLSINQLRIRQLDDLDRTMAEADVDDIVEINFLRSPGFHGRARLQLGTEFGAGYCRCCSDVARSASTAAIAPSPIADR